MGSDSRRSGLDPYAVTLIKRKARQLVGSYGFSEDDREDIEQDLTVDLLERLPRFDSSRASLHTFIARLVDHKVKSLIEHQEAQMRDYRRCAGSLNDHITDEDGNEVELGDLVSEDDYLRSMGSQAAPVADLVALRGDLERLTELLPPELQSLCEGVKQRASMTEIARRMGVSRDTVYERLREIGRRAEEAGLRTHLEPD